MKITARLRTVLIAVQPLVLNPKVWNALLGAATLFGILAPATATSIRDTIIGPLL